MDKTFEGWIKILPDTERERELVALHIRYKKFFLKKQIELGAEKASGEISEKTASALQNLIKELREIERVYGEYFPAGKALNSINPADVIPELRHYFNGAAAVGAVASPEGSQNDRQIWRGTWAGLIEQEFKLRQYEIENGALTRRNFAKALTASWVRDNGEKIEETTTAKILNLMKYLSNIGSI